MHPSIEAKPEGSADLSGAECLCGKMSSELLLEPAESAKGPLPLRGPPFNQQIKNACVTAAAPGVVIRHAGCAPVFANYKTVRAHATVHRNSPVAAHTTPHDVRTAPRNSAQPRGGPGCMMFHTAPRRLPQPHSKRCSRVMPHYAAALLSPPINLRPQVPHALVHVHPHVHAMRRGLHGVHPRQRVAISVLLVQQRASRQ